MANRSRIISVLAFLGLPMAAWAGERVPELFDAPDPSPQPVTREWLVGAWVQSSKTWEVDRSSCNSGLVTTYLADGTSRAEDADGSWQLDGNRLREKITEVSDQGDPALIGARYTTRLRRVGPDEALARIDGKWRRMLRCRSGDFIR